MTFLAAHRVEAYPAHEFPIDLNREVPARFLLTGEFDPLIGIFY
jgi:hypothetical protein